MPTLVSFIYFTKVKYEYFDTHVNCIYSGKVKGQCSSLGETLGERRNDVERLLMHKGVRAKLIVLEEENLIKFD